MIYFSQIADFEAIIKPDLALEADSGKGLLKGFAF